MSTGNPEASAAVGAYRSLVPAGLRRRVARRVPAGLRTVLKHLLRRLHVLSLASRLFRGFRARRRWPHLFREGSGSPHSPDTATGSPWSGPPSRRSACARPTSNWS
ncbi:hypothetical protein ACFQ2H_08895 [Streptomyces violaceoruber]